MRWTWTSDASLGGRKRSAQGVGERTGAPSRTGAGLCADTVASGVRSGADSVTRDDPDRGSAIVEFIGLGLLLLIPVIYLVVTVARVQAGSFAVVAAAEQAGQAISVLEARDLNRTGIHDVAAVAAQDHGFDPQDLTVSVQCSDGTCDSPGAVARVHASLTVQLPGMPGFVTATVANLSADVSVVAGRYS